VSRKVDSSKVTDLTKQIVVDGIAGLPLKIGTCCLPKLFDPVMGYVTRGRGITVHKKWCKVVSRDLERLINLNWIGENTKRFYPVDLELKVADRVGLLSEISSLTSALGINIGSVVLTSKVPGEVIFRYQVEVYSYDQLVALMQKLQDISGVRYLRKL
jgi:GTP pyrophosphokinase